MAGKTPSKPRSTAARAGLLRAVLTSRPALLGLAAALPLLGGCNLRQIAGLDMYNQEKVEEYEPSEFFEDQQSARPLVDGTVPRTEVYFDRSSTGVEPVQYVSTTDGFPADFPKEGPALQAVLERGQTQYNVYCGVCHGQTGLGDGMIVQRGFVRPPSFVVPTDPASVDLLRLDNPYNWQRTEYLQDAPPGHYYQAITNGFGAMYSYADRVNPRDRWAIVAYIKTLQVTPAEVNGKPAPLVPQPTPRDRTAAE